MDDVVSLNFLYLRVSVCGKNVGEMWPLGVEYALKGIFIPEHPTKPGDPTPRRAQSPYTYPDVLIMSNVMPRKINKHMTDHDELKAISGLERLLTVLT